MRNYFGKERLQGSAFHRNRICAAAASMGLLSKRRPWERETISTHCKGTQVWENWDLSAPAIRVSTLIFGHFSAQKNEITKYYVFTKTHKKW